MIELATIDDDLVIKSKFLTGKTSYIFALEGLYPLIDRLDIQRNLQNPSFYKRLKEDIIQGCIMPPITIAMISNDFPSNLNDAYDFINKNIQYMFILDGIQRLNTLKSAIGNIKDFRNPEILKRPLFLNILICKSMDNLLYRMITLNNGQKPMSANHQIEILLGNVYKFSDLQIEIVTDKQKSQNGKTKQNFEKSNIIKGYLAFITDSISIDNKKIIDEKMDTLITKKIMDSKSINESIEFSVIISLISNLASLPDLKKWFDNTNNLIGFCVGIKKSYFYINEIAQDDFLNSINTFEKAFKSLNISTIKLSKERRNLSKYFIENFESLRLLDELDLLDDFNEHIL